ncbi:HD-GYP domain-containing protein [Rhizobium sp. VS19-DR104.2]|uniref:HD-GYP domain-containing protein n=1 Tax=unclassified Rhizobium TaxID=2613769 RepID=UPI001C5B5290|nr:MULTISPECIES: HD-GYP domain-containing protein [unclassified Rhizobium]MBZ5763764.1 HD-GYP domain-containing protein [Rhizobium sp. VS19-DR96]MBZ5769694.1 HD-GYP domain-containing protein [Rhizobium sp. VS19-DR129.2]MBZ5777035.1 HD-GYP domain-containing protein [Rhizobium sp. VS19-DRK62.2]MBZ5788110.1 HD-GYP domain-containing protein [Rhizobium sp. VS19-DR121]MBZ5805813.1 HD-GYP domain-containing protein [Rhizobium sp. VS19-DR181]
MLKRICKDQLRIGMFIEALEGSWLDTPFAGRRYTLECEEDAACLRNSNVCGVFINTSKGLDVLPAVAGRSKPDGPGRAVKTSSASSGRKIRILTADKIKRTSVLLKSIFDDVSAGAGVTVEMVSPVIEEITQSLDINPSILINMTRMKTKDEVTFLHSLSVSALMIRLARHLKLDAPLVPILGMSGLLHDIGKIGMPIEILTRAGVLTDAEMALIRRHPALGHRMLSRGKGMPDVVLDVALHHHERLDGKGYPMGLLDGQISLYARMAAICDVYDALTSTRPYKRPWTPSEATSWMLDTKGAFDRPLLREFIDGVIGA